MGWLSNLFGGKKAVDNILDKDNGLLTQVGGWIGNMNFTEEEKAKAKDKLNEGVSDFVKSTLSENTIRSRTRRKLALAWCYSELFFVFLTAACRPFDKELAEFYWQIVTSEIMFWGAIAALSFYLGPYMIGNMLGSTKK
jgi:hypothetical protein